MTRDYVLSRSDRAGMPETFTSVLEPPQISDVEWEEQCAQHTTLTLPKRRHERNDDAAKYPHANSPSTRTEIWASSVFKDV
jgi:hypothetical protein